MIELQELARRLAGATINVIDPSSAAASDPLPPHVLPVAIGCTLPPSCAGRGVQIMKTGTPRASANAMAERLDRAAVPVFGEPAGLTPASAASVQALSDSMCFFAKEAGPDSVLTAMMLLARRAGVAEAPHALSAWQAQADAWDAGRVPSQPSTSWAALSSVLTHAVYTEPGEGIVEPLRVAWQAGLDLMLETIASGHSPGLLPANLPEHGSRARAALRRLEAVYLDCLQHAQVVQLSVPLRAAPHRSLVVDAILCVEHEYSDALKIFARADAVHAAGGRGFALILSFRPTAPAWNRYTIHADPDCMLDLRPLWRALEEAEAAERMRVGVADRAIGNDLERARREAAGVRMRSIASKALRSRVGIPSKDLPVRRLGVVAHPWVDPWYIDPSCSMVASPGKFDPGPGAATCLQWAQVQAVFWATFRPLQAVRVRPLLRGDGIAASEWGAAQPILGTPPWSTDVVASVVDPFPLRVVRWSRDVPEPSSQRLAGPEVDPSGAQTIDLSPTALAMLARLAASPKPEHSMQLHGLPPAQQWERVELEGGFAVVARRGCILVDDWRDIAVDTPAVLQAMRAARRLAMHADAHAAAYLRHNERLKAIARASRGPFDRSLSDFLIEVADERAATAANDIDAEALQQADGNAATLFRALTRHWHTAERLQAVERGLARLEQSVRAQLESRSGLALKVISMVGLPLAAAGLAAKPIVSAANAALLAAGIRLPWGDEVAGSLKEAAELPVALACACLAYIVLRRWVVRLARPSGSDSSLSRRQLDQ